MEKEQRIRERAHAIWQEEGEPHGRHDEHWERASREFDEPAPTQPSAAPKPARRKSAAAKIMGEVKDTVTKPRAARPKKPAG